MFEPKAIRAGVDPCWCHGYGPLFVTSRCASQKEIKLAGVLFHYLCLEKSAGVLLFTEREHCGRVSG